jgi:acetyl-CoA C-acetyltransferase
MAEAYIIDALRTPTGKRKGALGNVHPADLGGFVLKTLVGRNAVPADDIEDVIFGCLDNVGPNAGNVARSCWLAGGLPLHVPGVTIDRQCGSAQQAVHFAAQGVMSGTSDVIIAGGVQNMTMIPIMSGAMAGKALGINDPYSGSTGWRERFGDAEITQYNGAELMCEKWGLSRLDLEKFALESHTRGRKAIAEGRFKREIVPFNGLETDETTRETSLEQMAALQTLRPGGKIHAGVASQIADGASAVLVASERAVKKYNLKPRARIHHMSVYADDPVMMLSAPIPATRMALKKAGMKMSDIDLVEINEAFAPVPLAWLKELDYPAAQTNVNGGAIALGHPLGSTGTKLMTTLLHELERTHKRWGLQTMCEGGGVANVTIIERLSV